MSLGYKIMSNDPPEINLSGQNGGISVDKENDGLAESRLKSVLGNEYNSILNACFSHASRIQAEGSHPQQVKIELAARDVAEFDKIWASYDLKDKSEAAYQARTDFAEAILKIKSADESVVKRILELWNEGMFGT